MTTITEELIARLKQGITSGVDLQPRQVNVGTVIAVGDGVARLSGLDQVVASEIVEFPPKAGRNESIYGIALNLEQDSVAAIILGDDEAIEEGDMVTATERVISVPVGQGLLGRVVNPLGQPIDGKGPIIYDKTRPIERIAPGVITRKSVDTPVQTGIIAIDALIPIGRGQRELIIGDRQTGKTAVAVDTIINQKARGWCVSTLRLGSVGHRWRRSSGPWSGSVRWSIPSWCQQPLLRVLHCNISPLTPVVRWVKRLWRTV